MRHRQQPNGPIQPLVHSFPVQLAGHRAGGGVTAIRCITLAGPILFHGLLFKLVPQDLAFAPIAGPAGVNNIVQDFKEPRPHAIVARLKCIGRSQRPQAGFLHQVLGFVTVAAQVVSQPVDGLQLGEDELLQ